MALPRNLRPIRLSRRPKPFNSADWIFEIKFDGFRSLAFIEGVKCDLVSRNGNVFKTFPHLSAVIAGQLDVENAVLDGEIVCLDEHGRSVFNDLLFRRGVPYFYAFDMLWLNGQDLRGLPLVERKRRLRTVVPKHDTHVLYLDHIENDGVKLCSKKCANSILRGSLRNGSTRNIDRPRGRHPTGSKSRIPGIHRPLDVKSCSNAPNLAN